ncbi:MAG: helix-turn-helix transcriptional regulator [Gemmiger sp.]|uniref:helix-turn-helix domain-containing protein n=1 Tax=Gemmiger sp. TaxID=2049027 RepID=UPI002E75E021|nr:helix-turn-helix transcriptional regulator [Gemmiger sp.]MEE0801076.1 helix-turn-helix transcriptional regulator [Gemmiger sp.]
MYSIFERLLAEHGTTAYRVAKETGISTATLTDWKKGRSTPKVDKLQKIADYFGVSLDYLCGKTDEPNPPDLLDEIDVGFYGEYRELSEDDKEAVRDFVRVMRERRARQKQE